MDTVALLPYAHVAATGVMVGVIWFCQLVHYPLLALVSDKSWGAYEIAHCNRITAIVGPAMGVELVAAVALCVPGIWWDEVPWMAWASVAKLPTAWRRRSRFWRYMSTGDFTFSWLETKWLCQKSVIRSVRGDGV